MDRLRQARIIEEGPEPRLGLVDAIQPPAGAGDLEPGPLPVATAGGHKRAFAIGCVLYGIGSFTTALAPNLAVLILGWSVLEGVGAALIQPAIVALVASNVARSERPRAYGLVASAGAIAVAAGPPIGGLFTTYLPWWAVLRRAVVLSVALGLSTIATGARLLPLSVTLLLAAAGIPKAFPDASPRRVVQVGTLALIAGIVAMVAALDAGAGPEIVTWPMLLAGLGIGALASQLGAVTVSSVPDEQSSEVGGLQTTCTNLGASIGTALAGAVLISTLTTTFLTGLEQNPAVPAQVTTEATVELADGIPFVSDADIGGALADAGVPSETGGRHRRGERRRPPGGAAHLALDPGGHRPGRPVLHAPAPHQAARPEQLTAVRQVRSGRRRRRPSLTTSAAAGGGAAAGAGEAAAGPLHVDTTLHAHG